MVSKLELTVILFVVLLARSNSLSSLSDDNRGGTMEKRQDPPFLGRCDAYPDNFQEYLQDSSECVNIAEIPVVIRDLEGDLAANTKANRRLLRNTLDGFCNTACYDNVVFYYTSCVDFGQDQLNLYQNAVCGRDGGTYCAIAALEDIANGDINTLEIELQCDTFYSDACPRQECIDVLEGISNRLGCCAGSLFNNSITDFSPFLSTLDEEYYERCNLTLPAPCSGHAFLPAKPVVIALVLSALLLFAF